MGITSKDGLIQWTVEDRKAAINTPIGDLLAKELATGPKALDPEVISRFAQEALIRATQDEYQITPADTPAAFIDEICGKLLDMVETYSVLVPKSSHNVRGISMIGFRGNEWTRELRALATGHLSGYALDGYPNPHVNGNDVIVEIEDAENPGPGTVQAGVYTTYDLAADEDPMRMSTMMVKSPELAA